VPLDRGAAAHDALPCCRPLLRRRTGALYGDLRLARPRHFGSIGCCATPLPRRPLIERLAQAAAEESALRNLHPHRAHSLNLLELKQLSSAARKRSHRSPVKVGHPAGGCLKKRRAVKGELPANSGGCRPHRGSVVALAEPSKHLLPQMQQNSPRPPQKAHSLRCGLLARTLRRPAHPVSGNHADSRPPWGSRPGAAARHTPW